MSSEPAPTKHTSALSRLLPLFSSLALFVFLTWNMRHAQMPDPVPEEILAGGRALKANNLDRAQQLFEKFIKKAPESPVVYIAVISQCNALKQWKLCFEYGERAIQACKYAPNADRAGLYKLLADCCLSIPEPRPQRHARWYAQRAFELNPDDPDVLNTLGYLMADNAQTIQDANLAKGYIDKALLKLRSQTAPSPYLLAGAEDSYGWALYKRGQFTPADYAYAVAALNRAIDDLPSDTPGNDKKVFYYHLGVANRTVGHLEEARHALQVALYYDPNYEDAKKELNALPSPSAPVPPTSSTGPDGKPVFTPLKLKK